MYTKAHLRTLSTPQLRKLFANEPAERAWLVDQIYARSAPKKTHKHPTYEVMITKALLGLKQRNGSSRHAVKAYIMANYDVTEKGMKTQFNQQVRRLVERGVIAFASGPSSTMKITPEHRDALNKKTK